MLMSGLHLSDLIKGTTYLLTYLAYAAYDCELILPPIAQIVELGICSNTVTQMVVFLFLQNCAGIAEGSANVHSAPHQHC